MEITGEYEIAAPREAVWAALNDPEVLARCSPGCDSREQTRDTTFAAKVTAAVGPVKAKFNTRLSLEDLNPPESYRLVGESKAAAGFGKGTAEVRLEAVEGGTLLRYSADFKVGGKLAQVGSRLVVGATRKTADDFFSAFSSAVDPGATKVESDEPVTRAANPWPYIVGGAAVLLILWFLLG